MAKRPIYPEEVQLQRIQQKITKAERLVDIRDQLIMTLHGERGMSQTAIAKLLDRAVKLEDSTKGFSRNATQKILARMRAKEEQS